MTLEEAKKNIQERMNILLKRYGEWKDAHPGWFASGELIGQVEGLEEAMGILDDVDTEPVVKDKLTLTELARELRKIFKFKYLTYNEYGILCIWAGEKPKPEYIKDFCFWNFYPERTFTIGSIDTKTKDCVGLDLSEYKDADGNIDYSKCIVEVTDASE